MLLEALCDFKAVVAALGGPTTSHGEQLNFPCLFQIHLDRHCRNIFQTSLFEAVEGTKNTVRVRSYAPDCGGTENNNAVGNLRKMNGCDFFWETRSITRKSPRGPRSVITQPSCSPEKFSTAPKRPSCAPRPSVHWTAATAGREKKTRGPTQSCC